MRYLITGATGEVGSRVVRQLAALGERPRIFVRDTQKAEALFRDRVEIAQGDLGDQASLQNAMAGIDSVFLVNSGPQIPERDALAAKAARNAGVRRIVKLSTLDVQYGLALGVWHERGEAAVQASGIPYTFVRPTGFMSNLLAWAHSIQAEGVVRSSTGNGRRAFIHSDDIAAVSVAALTSQVYEGQAPAITGPEALTFAEVTEQIGSAIGRKLTYQAISDEEARSRYARVSGSEEEIEAHVALWRAIREGRLGAVTDTVERVVGRAPKTLSQWLVENAAAFR